MGDWLPDAHPVAPSGMSATLSGALVKLGIYGLVRLFCSFLVVSPSLRMWGIILALAGTGSLFVGTLTALRQTDTKRLMAFHTIGQIGYICLGLGVGAYCLHMYPALASIALAGAIFHAVNHACFKSCLFLGAGSVLYRTGKRDMDKLGGLAGFMPYTTGTTAIASLSIAGVPPFNGFASKWLIVAGCLLAGMRFPLFLVLGLVALFISLATLASFLKVLGSVFLGKADENLGIEEVPISMIVPQVVLAALCVLLGIFPQLLLRFVGHAIEGVTAMPASGVDASRIWGGLSLIDGSPVGVLVAPRHSGGLGHPGVDLLCHSARGRSPSEVGACLVLRRRTRSGHGPLPRQQLLPALQTRVPGNLSKRKSACAEIPGSPSPRARF